MRRSLPLLKRQHFHERSISRSTGNTTDHHRYGEVKTRLTIEDVGASRADLIGGTRTVERPATGVESKRKGPQLALEPLNGRGIAGYVPEPELWERSWEIAPREELTCCRRARCAR